jgi:hypothetical protein
MKITNKDIIIFVKTGSVSKEDLDLLRSLENVALVAYRDECPVVVTRDSLVDYGIAG